MKTSDKKLKNFVSVNASFPVYLVEKFTKKELTDRDCYYLRYCLMRFVLNNQGQIWEFQDVDPETVYYKVDEESSICDESLCIGSFEGYRITEKLEIKSLELSTENRVILTVYNKKTEEYFYYLID